MTIFRFSLAAFAFLALTSCAAAEEEVPLPNLSDEQKVQRMQLCMTEIERWRDAGVWIHGGVQPAVNRDRWGDLSNDDKQKIADIAACIQSSGDWSPQEVQIVSEGFKVPIKILKSQNKLFREKFQ
jgi:hypothetical protein